MAQPRNREALSLQGKDMSSDGGSEKAPLKEGLKADKKTGKKSKLSPAPSTGTAVNIAIAEIVLRNVANAMRGKVQADISQADAHKRASGERDAVDGRSLITSIGLYGAGRLAGKSRAGLGLVAGGLLAKSLYERGKAVRERRAKRGR